MGKIRKKIRVTGIVQGVGFRPFVYNLAKKYSLLGWVQNNSQGLIIDIEGEIELIDSFISYLKSKPPSLAKIDSLEAKEVPLKKYDGFLIQGSTVNDNGLTLISPDIAMCQECQKEIKDRKNRRHHYPFTNCSNCGPRYSIMEALPYDRGSTTMKSFSMCDNCRREYQSPQTRRFHTQPNSCPECGPQLWLTNSLGEKLEVADPVDEAIKLLKAGKIIAIKGLGGFHLACDGKNKDVIAELRRRKRRPHKALALMISDLTVVKRYCYLNQQEQRILTGIKRPILLLDKKKSQLPANIAPDSTLLGVMLPYTPLHQLLFDKGLEVLVMTSANLSGLPLQYINHRALDELEEIADYFLLHNRDIHIPIDDSVVRVLLGKECLIRRARGYVPLPIKYRGLKESLACGSQSKSTFAISDKDYIFLSQHLGNIDNLENYQNYKIAIKHLQEIYQIKPKIIAYDLHPEYLGSEFAHSHKGKQLAIQHHHAHLVSCMVENQVNTKVIGLAFDGTGLGSDGHLWGGEFLICDYSDFTRVGQLNYVKMPGGEQAIKEPWRMAISYLYQSYGEKIDLQEIMNFNQKKITAIIKLLKKSINSPKTSSMGRLFDGVAALLGLIESISYEGQGAIRLECIATQQEVGKYRYQIEENNGYYIIDTTLLIKDIVSDIKAEAKKEIIAKRFHNTIISLSVEVCELLRAEYNLNLVALSGGVFQNELLLTGIYQRLLAKGFKVYLHSKVPCNDGGLALGQLAIANHQKRGQLGCV